MTNAEGSKGNPFSRALAIGAPKDVAALVDAWDQLESLAIHIYRVGEASGQDEADFTALQAWLAPRYAKRRDVLEPHWRASRVGHDPTTDDPFDYLLSLDAAADLVDNRDALVRLPAIREALNRWLLTFEQEG